MARPKGSHARAYTEDLGAVASGGLSVTRGACEVGRAVEVVVVEGEEGEERVRSQILMVRSKEPEAIQFCSRLCVWCGR